jgi:hypothetical protein
MALLMMDKHWFISLHSIKLLVIVWYVSKLSCTAILTDQSNPITSWDL